MHKITFIHLFLVPLFYPPVIPSGKAKTVLVFAGLDRIMCSAARLVGGIPRAGRVSGYTLDVFRWLPFRQSIIFLIAVLVWRCSLDKGQLYYLDVHG